MKINIEKSATSGGGASPAGMAIVYVLVILCIVGFLSYTVASLMRSESQFSFNFAEAEVAVSIAENGIEHALYLLKNHKYSDQKGDGTPSSLKWNEKFATQDQFTLTVPTNNPDDDCFDKLRGVDINSVIREEIPGGGIDSIEMKYRTVRIINQFRKIGELIISCSAHFGRARRKVEVVKKIFLFKDLPVRYDHALYVNSPSLEEIPGRRKTRSLFGNYVRQSLLVNGKVFGRELAVYLNLTDPLLMLLGYPKSMILKLADPRVDPAASNRDNSPLYKFAEGLIPNIRGTCVEYDYSGGWDVITRPNGTRGNVDLTGTFPAGLVEAWLLALFGRQVDTTPNEIYGNVMRRYAYYDYTDDSFFESIADILQINPPVKVDSEPYCSWVNKNPDYLQSNYPPLIPDLLSEQEYRDISRKIYNQPGDFEDIRFEAGNIFGISFGVTTYNRVKKYWGWGLYSDIPKTSIFHNRNGMEAARLKDSRAIKLNGVEFVDGDVFIEGYYKGRGTIVARGNIYIGGPVLRHPNDDDGTPKEVDDGDDNYLQLVALPVAGNNPKGKIIFRPHHYNQDFYEWGMLSSAFTDTRQMEVQAFIYAANGISTETDEREEAFRIWGSDDNTYVSIKGNLVVEKLNTSDETKQNMPDRMMIYSDPLWLALLDSLKNDSRRIAIALGASIEKYSVKPAP